MGKSVNAILAVRGENEVANEDARSKQFGAVLVIAVFSALAGMYASV